VFGVTAAGVALPSVASATLAGGLLTELVTWRATLVLPALSLGAVPLCLRAAAQRHGSGQPVDILGASHLAVTATTVVLLIQAHTLALALPLVAAIALLAALAATALAWRVHRAPDGFLPRALAADRTFLLAGATGFGVFGGVFGAMYAVAQLLVHTHGWSVLAVGTALLPGAVAGAALSLAASRLAASRLGGHRLLAALATACAIALAVAGLTGGATVALIAGAFFGFAAFAVTQVVLTNQISASVPTAQRGAAMGLLNLAFLTGGAVGSATAGALSRPLGLPAALACVAALPLMAGALALHGRAVNDRC
jgi:DHA2 family metal-tetracycline-proton antiporter-like MFS transporter